MIEKIDQILNGCVNRDDLERAIHQNDDLALILVWFEADKTTYTPQNNDFLKWKLPSNRLEFDHRGNFKKVSKRLWLYDGAESKANFNAGNIYLCRGLTV